MPHVQRRSRQGRSLQQANTILLGPPKHIEDLKFMQPGRVCVSNNDRIRPLGRLIVRAHLLTHIASEEPRANAHMQFGWNHTAVLDCERSNTAASIEMPRRERLGRARIDAACTGAARVIIDSRRRQ